MKYCKCWKILSVKDAISDLLDEIIEFISSPSKDELSDCMFAIGRLFGAIMHKEYVHVAFDNLHIVKINSRMREYGCIRSHNHKCRAE